MDGWVIGLIALLVVGIAVIAYGGISDRRRHRRAVAELLSAPPRPIPQLPADAPQPRYLPAALAHRPLPGAERDELTAAERDRLARLLNGTGTVTVDLGFASDAFVTDRAGGRAILERPRCWSVPSRS